MAGADEEPGASAGLDGLAWLFGLAGFLAAAEPPGRSTPIEEDAEAAAAARAA